MSVVSRQQGDRADSAVIWVGPVPSSEGNRAVWFGGANCPFKTPIHSLTCSSNTVQNGPFPEPPEIIFPQAGFSRFGTIQRMVSRNGRVFTPSRQSEQF